jgi:hypothetical protein
MRVRILNLLQEHHMNVANFIRATTAAVVALASAVVANAGVNQEIRFKPGTTSAAVEQAVIRGERDQYLLGAGKGQYITVTIQSIEDNAVFDVFLPGAKSDHNGYVVGSTLPGGKEATTFSGQLPTTGKFLIVVGGTRGNATYKMTVSVQNDASKAIETVATSIPNKPVDTGKTVSDEPAYSITNEQCSAWKVAAFRKENGNAPLITNDMLKEWEEECSALRPTVPPKANTPVQTPFPFHKISVSDPIRINPWLLFGLVVGAIASIAICRSKRERLATCAILVCLAAFGGYLKVTRGFVMDISVPAISMFQTTPGAVSSSHSGGGITDILAVNDEPELLIEPTTRRDGQFKLGNEPKDSTVQAMIDLGDLVSNQGRHHDAQVSYIMAYRIAVRKHGRESVQTGDALSRIAMSYDDFSGLAFLDGKSAKQDKYLAAAAITWPRVIAIYAKQLGDKDKKTIEAREMAALSQEKGK